MVWDSEFLREEIENWVEIGFDVRGENLGAHAEDPGKVLVLDAFREKEGDDGVNGFHCSCAEVRVLGQCFTCIDTHYLETQDFLFELKGEFCVGCNWCVEWVVLEEGFGFGS